MCTGGFKLCKVLLIHSLSVLRTKETFLLEQMKQTSSGRCMKHLCGHKGRNVHYFHQIYKAVCTHGSLLLGMGVDIPLISGFNIKTLLAPQPIGYSSENNSVKLRHLPGGSGGKEMCFIWWSHFWNHKQTTKTTE